MYRLFLQLVLCAGLALISGHESGAAKSLSLPVRQVAIVRDGPSELVPELGDLVRKEIVELTSRAYDVRFPDHAQVDGGWSVNGVRQAIDRVLSDPHIDLVIALGILVSNEVSQRKQLPKPVIAPLVLDPQLQATVLIVKCSALRDAKVFDA